MKNRAEQMSIFPQKMHLCSYFKQKNYSNVDLSPRMNEESVAETMLCCLSTTKLSQNSYHAKLHTGNNVFRQLFS